MAPGRWGQGQTHQAQEEASWQRRPPTCSIRTPACWTVPPHSGQVPTGPHLGLATPHASRLWKPPTDTPRASSSRAPLHHQLMIRSAITSSSLRNAWPWPLCPGDGARRPGDQALGGQKQHKSKITAAIKPSFSTQSYCVLTSSVY